MIYDLQKASFLKRLAAFMLDAILLLILGTGLMLVSSSVLNIDGHYDVLESAYQKYEQQYGTSFQLTQEEYDALPEAERAVVDAAYEAFSQDEEALYAYNMLVNLLLLMIPLSIFVAYLVLEFGVPMLFGNGQTAGKKIFSIAVMRTDGVRVTPFMMFARAILGKCTIETLVPVLLIIMLFFGLFSTVALIVLVLILLLQVILVAKTQNHSAIHDLMACTVVVDVNSQMIFDSQEHRLEYRKRFEEENSTGK